MSLGGAQPKVSMSIDKGELLIVSEGGEYLLKPSTENHPYISENEHLCMNIAAHRKLNVPPCCVIELKDGELAFLIKRFDRNKKKKVHIEDFASVLNYPSDNKYKGSYLEIGKGIQKYCRDNGLDKAIMLHLVMLSFLIGNSDLHLKNFSLIDRDTYYALSPVYDLVCTTLYYPQTEMALELIPGDFGSLVNHGFYTARDFIELGKALDLEEKVIMNLVQSLINDFQEVNRIIANSFLPSKEKIQLEKIVSVQYKKFQSADK